MNCPRCNKDMRAYRVDGQLDREVDIDVCMPCQSIWFDTNEHLQLTAGATLKMFHVIGENVSRPVWQDKDVAHCPRCRAQLRRTQDLQRATRFEYYKCPNNHGRLTSFFDFLKEKDFIKPLSPHQIAELRKYAHAVNCSNCGAPVDVAANAHCTHCGSPLTMLDLEQADRLIEQLKSADHQRVIDPALPLALAKAKRDTELIFTKFEGRHTDDSGGDAIDLVGAGFTALMRLLNKHD